MGEDRPVIHQEALGQGSRDGELLERAHELEALGALIARAAAGEGGVVVVEGPAGIGKSRLLDVARWQAAAAGMLALRARASELEAEYPFGVVRQLFEPALARLDDAESLFTGAAGLARHFVDPSAPPVPSTPQADGFAAFHGLYWLTANIAERGGLVLTVDDVQWCDPASLQFLAYLVPRLDDLAVGVVVGARTGEEGTHGAAFAAVAADPSAVRVRPAGLSERAVRELLGRAFGDEPEDEFAEACHRSTAGNPLLVHELVGALRAMGITPTASYAEAVPRVGAEAVRGFVLRRLDHLTDAARGLAMAVAVLGDGTELELAAALAGLERAPAIDASMALVRADLFAGGTQLGFVHPLVRLAVYETIVMSERELLHARAAALLAQAGAPAERVALQLMHAPPGSADHAVDTLREAARQAMREGVPSAAVAFLTRALSEPLEASARGSLRYELGEAALRTDPRSAVEHLGEAIALLDDPDARARARLRLGRALNETGRNHEAIDVLELALADGPLPSAELQDRLEYELINALLLDVQIERAVERAVVVHRRHTSGEVVSGHFGLVDLAWLAITLPLSRREAAEYASAALADDVLLHEDTDAFVNAAEILIAADEYPLARAAVDKAREQAVAGGSVSAFAWASELGSMIFYFLGQLDEAEAEARTGLDAAESHRLLARPWLASALGDILIERGRLEEAAAVIRSARSADPAHEGFALLVSDMQLGVDQGRPEDALPALAELRRRFDRAGGGVPAPHPWRSTGARALAALGRSEEALELARTEVDMARSWGAPRPLGRALRILGALEGGAAGLASLREAVAVLEDSPARLERAHALAALGAAVRRAGRRPEARELLRRALDLAHLSGAHALEEQVRAELVVAGARPRRSRLHGIEALTASELRIAQLAASGQMNKEIAQDLFVALKTVETHLASIYRKLGVRSRTELSSVLSSGEPASGEPVV